MSERDGDQLPETDRLRADRMFYRLREGSREVARELERLVKKYPGTPSLKNHLAVAYSTMGLERKADKIGEQLLRENPNYLFGHLNHAASFLKRGEEHRIPELLGETLNLADFRPDTDLFHTSEVNSYYKLVAHFHLMAGRIGLARAIHDTLLEIIGPSEGLEQLSSEIGQKTVLRLRELMEAEDARAIKTVPPPIDPGHASSTLPRFHHGELAELYREGFDIPPSTIDSILALPRETLVKDLVTVITNGFDRVGLDLEVGFDEFDADGYFMLHAIFFLGELQASEALDDVLRAVSVEAKVCDLWFGEYGDIIETDVWEPIYRLARADIERLCAFMLSPGISHLARNAVSIAVAQIALHEPERRAEVLDWFERVLKHMLDCPPEDNVLDTRLITSMVADLIDIEAIELLPLVKLLFDKGYVGESMVGDMEIIEAEMTARSNDHMTRPLHGLKKRYERIASPERRPPSGAGDVAGFDLFGGTSPAVSAKPAAGRNDPCPCGSGKKFKKCCL